MRQLKEQSAWERVIKPWWAKLAVGVVSLVLAVLTYNDFAKLESGERKSLWVGRSTAVLYDVGGKWLATSVPVLIGVAFVIWAGVQLTRGKES